MKWFGVACVTVPFVLCSYLAGAAEGAGPDRDSLRLDPFAERPAPEEERSPLGAVGKYVGDRFRDLADIVTLKLGWGTHRSLGFQARATRLVQIGAGMFEGWVFAVDHGCVGTMKEVEIEGGISIYYLGYIARKVNWQTDEAEYRNVFFGDVGEKAELALEDLKMYDDENQGWFTVTAQLQAPCLPKVELTVNLGEIFDFPLSFFAIDGFRVPPAFHKQAGPDGPDGERIPAPSIFWHGQEEYEKYQ